MNNHRFLLAELRSGDYAHPGDTEAIDIVIGKILELQNKKYANTDSNDETKLKALDVGCGLGGTANYFKNNTPFEIYGIDIEANAIAHAHLYYPDIHSLKCDVMEVESVFNANYFDLIYLFNVFYALPLQKESLKKLEKVAKQDSLLVIFDYVKYDMNLTLPKDFSGKEINPLNMDNIVTWLDESNWELIEIVDLSLKYQVWYENFLSKLMARKKYFIEKFTREVVTEIEDTFSLILSIIKNKKMGGVIVYAKQRSHKFNKTGF